MSDGVRLRVVSYTAQCVRVVCSVSVVSVYPFLRLGHCTRSHRTGLCQHAFPKGETSVHCTPDVSGYTLPQPLCAQYQDPEPLALPWPAWELKLRQQGVSILASQTSWAKASGCSPFSTNARGGPHHPCGLYSTEARDSEKPLGITAPCTETSPIKDSDESVIQPYGWKAHVSSSRMDGS